MSFVICKKFGDVICLHADTRSWSGSAALKNDIFKGFLKLVIISPSVCVGWAGNGETAKDAFEAMDGEGINTEDGIAVARFLALNTDSASTGNDAEFIVACGGVDKRIFRISDHQCIEVGGSAWIGHDDAFRAFQRQWILEGEASSKQRAFENSFRVALADSSAETVGDFQITAGARAEGFRYRAYGVTAFPKQRIDDEVRKILLKGRAEGGYSVSCLASRSVEKPGCALYFMPAEFGVVLTPEAPFEFSERLHLPINEFLSYVVEKYGIVLAGSVVDKKGKHIGYGDRPLKLRSSVRVDSDSDAKAVVEIHQIKGA